MTEVTAGVTDRRPPAWFERPSSVVLRRLLRTPVGRAIGALALLEFTGRRTGRELRIVVGWHEHEGQPVVFTPAAWRWNFAGGAPVVVHHRGAATDLVGTLDADPAEVARALNGVITSGTSPHALGMRVPPGHRLTPAEVERLPRAMIRLAGA